MQLLKMMSEHTPVDLRREEDEEHSMQAYTEIAGFRTTTTGKVTVSQN
jgi:hypothetical protein